MDVASDTVSFCGYGCCGQSIVSRPEMLRLATVLFYRFAPMDSDARLTSFLSRFAPTDSDARLATVSFHGWRP